MLLLQQFVHTFCPPKFLAAIDMLANKLSIPILTRAMVRLRIVYVLLRCATFNAVQATI